MMIDDFHRTAFLSIILATSRVSFVGLDLMVLRSGYSISLVYHRSQEYFDPEGPQKMSMDLAFLIQMNEFKVLQ